MLLKIPQEEFKERQARFINKIRERDLEGAVIFSIADIFYLTGFHFNPSERPMALFVNSKNEVNLFVPSLEDEHAEEYSIVHNVYTYPEYPGLKHPMEYFKELLEGQNFSALKVGYDSNGYGSAQGYRGPPLTSLFSDVDFTSIQGLIEEMRFIKSSNEIELIKESARWGNLGHRLLQKYTKAGLTEIEVVSKATNEATNAMINTLGPDYRPHGRTAYGLFRGQIGAESAFPHAVTQNATFKKGDTLVTGAGGDVFGYKSELERVMFVEEYSAEQKMYFDHMLNAQSVAFNSIKPGKPYSSVEEEVQRYFKDEGITHLTKHHTGHNIGILGHEAPFFDLGDDTMMEPGMVVTIEPGIYVKGLGGFRNSDTAVITKDSMELLTYYPRDIDSLICT